MTTTINIRIQFAVSISHYQFLTQINVFFNGVLTPILTQFKMFLLTKQNKMDHLPILLSILLRLLWELFSSLFSLFVAGAGEEKEMILTLITLPTISTGESFRRRISTNQTTNLLSRISRISRINFLSLISPINRINLTSTPKSK